MRIFNWGLVLGCAALALSGCGASPSAPAQATTAPAVGNPADAMPMANSGVKGMVKDGVYVNAVGKPICPVTGDVVAGKGAGSTTYKGVKYIFCCPGCPEQFKAHPEKFAIKESSAATAKTAKSS